VELPEKKEAKVRNSTRLIGKHSVEIKSSCSSPSIFGIEKN
jgi:hypothetical protein